jgi:predicted NBD/HSP70 family sugar kinase
MAETVKYLSIAVSSVASILNPEMIIIGGETVGRFGDLLLEPIKEMIGGVVPVMPDLVLSQLDDDAVVMGAIALALRSTEDFIFIKGKGKT